VFKRAEGEPFQLSCYSCVPSCWATRAEQKKKLEVACISLLKMVGFVFGVLRRKLDPRSGFPSRVHPVVLEESRVAPTKYELFKPPSPKQFNTNDVWRIPKR